MKRARTYRARADGCEAGVGRVATTGPHCPTTSLQRATTAGSARRRIDSSRQRVRELKKKRATTGTQRPTTGTRSGDDGCCSYDDDGDCATTAEIARRRVADRATTGPTPCGRVAATVYKGRRLDRDSRSD